jgi:sigma-B regulation protein RsbU (phosphoserine phosphatase)
VQPLALDAEAGPVLGGFEEAAYETLQCTLSVADSVVLFTDGLFEVEGATGEYGEEGLQEAVRQRLHLPLAPMFDAVMAEIQEFSGTEDFEDDVCLVGMEVMHIGSSSANGAHG